MEVFAKLSLRQKIAQLCIVAAVSNEEKNQKLMDRWYEWALYLLDHAYIEDLIIHYQVGGVIFYGSNTTAQEQAALTDHFQSLSEIPLFIALDAETGLDDRLHEESVISYPCAMALGAIHDPRLAYKLGAELAQQLKKIGVHMAFTPIVDVNSNPANPIIGLRSFGSQKGLVTLMGLALMNGLQDNGVIACAKHFPGHGDTSQDSHEMLPTVNQDLAIALYPFKELIDAGVKAVMTAHLEVPALEKQKGLASSLSYSIVTTLLQYQMGFNGLIITDALGMKGASDCAEPGELELQALLAGNDILLCPVDAARAIDYIEQAVYDGKISEEEINSKVLKVLHAKAWAMSDENEDDRSIEEVLQSQEAHDLQELLFCKSITLAKRSCENPFAGQNNRKFIISILENDDDDSIDTSDMFGTEIPGTKNELDTILSSNFDNADHVIVTIHTMNRFADKNYGIPNSIDDLIISLKNQGKQVTVVLFGTPYAIPLVNEADDILIAYEDWPAAHKAVADIISGKKVSTGILPVKVK